MVGGGNVAMDAARCAKRLGAEVHIVYRRSEAELPARAEEVHHAKEEGIIFDLLTNPVSIQGDEKGHVESIDLHPHGAGRARRLRPPPPGARPGQRVHHGGGRRHHGPGHLSQPHELPSGTPGLETHPEGLRGCGRGRDTPSVEGVFAGGDAATGAATVILAMGAGKHAAKSIDEYLKSKK